MYRTTENNWYTLSDKNFRPMEFYPTECTKNCLYLQIRLDICDVHDLLFQGDRFDYVSFHVILFY